MYKTADGTVTVRAYEYDFTSACSLARRQYEYFSKLENCYINGEVIEINNVDQIENAVDNLGIQIGDLMYFANDNGVHHATMITGFTNDDILFSAHTRSRQNQSLAEVLGTEKVYIIRIRDDA